MGTSVWGQQALITDYARAVRRPRHRRWQRDPKLVVAGIAAAVVGLIAAGADVYGGLNVGQAQHVQVHAGDSLWSIASSHYSSGDMRDHVSQIIAANHLGGASISPGQTLELPAP
jgi:nucleoid-associated protein YgaU